MNVCLVSASRQTPLDVPITRFQFIQLLSLWYLLTTEVKLLKLNATTENVLLIAQVTRTVLKTRQPMAV